MYLGRATSTVFPRGQSLWIWLLIFACAAVLIMAVQTLAIPDLTRSPWLFVVLTPLALGLSLALTVEHTVILLLVATPLLRFLGALSLDVEFVSSGMRDVILLMVYARWATAVLRQELPLPKHFASLIWLGVLLWGGTQMLRVDDLFAGLFAFRDWFRFVPLYFVVMSLLQDRPKVLKNLLYAMVLAGTLLAAFQLSIYVFIDEFPDFWYGTRTFRAIGPFVVFRMPTLLAGGPSGLGLFMASIVAIPFTIWFLRKPAPRWWFLGTLAMATVIVLTTATSAWIGLFGSITLASWIARRSTITALIILISLGVIVAANLSEAVDPAVITKSGDVLSGEPLRTDVALDTLIGGLDLTEEYFRSSANNALFGQGLSLIGDKPFLEADVQEALRLWDVDSGWMGHAIHLGYPVTLALALTIFMVFIAGVGMIRRRHDTTDEIYDLKPYYAAAVAGLFATLFSFHTIPWQRIGLDANFFILLAATSILGRPSLFRKGRSNF